MFSSKNIQMNERKNRSKVTRYAIKKLSMGTASVAVALGFMFVQGQTIVHADTVEATSAETTAKPAEEKKDTVEDDKAVYEVAVEKPEATTAAEGVTPAEKTEETTAAAEKKEETTAATEKAEETTAAPEKKEETTVAEENKPRTRSRRAVAEGEATPASDDTVGEDVVDATSTPKVEKPGFTPKILAEQLLKQVSWLDFGDKANWTGAETTADGKLALQVGATYTKEVMPGYVVKIKVKSLKPFQATEIYKKRLEERGATDEEKATYDPNAKNGYINSIGDATTRKAFNNKEEARVIADPQNRWTEIRSEGIDTGTKSTTISSEFNGGNIGVQFDISATYKGKAVKPAIVMADGESANPGELVLFTTNGSGWQHVGEWLKNNNKNTKNYVPQDTADIFDPSKNYGSVNVDGANISALNLNLLRRATAVGEEGKTVAWKYYGSADLKTGGLGTGVFGPNVSASRIAVPIVMTRGASEVGLYIASSGKQSAMLGFLPLDEGDAPDSYGIATHAMNQVNGVTGAAVNQPYFGDTRPDMDENLERTDWKGDDKDGTGDEGIDQILPTDLKGNTNGMIALARTRPGNYTLTVQANTGGAPEAYVYGWVDFNQNGKFDENERSEKATITKDGNVTLEFNNGPILNDLQLDKLGVRVRTSTYAPDIESPTGMSMSGEVEDFETQVIFPPKGSKKETTNLQGVKQTATVEFTAQGKQRYSRTEDAVIDETVAPFIVDEQGNKVDLDAEGFYVVPGEGKYRVTGAGKDVQVEFIPENGFVGTAAGITIRRLDNNAVDTGWNTKDNSQPVISDQTNTMDGRYIPTVTPLSEEVTTEDLQGLEHDKKLTFTNGSGEVKPSATTPMVIVNPETGVLIGNEAPAMKDGKVVGLYEIDPVNGTVKFTPNKDFIGTPDPILIQVVDEATGRSLAGIKYTPTVLPVTPVGENKETTGKQGQPQSDTVTFKQQDGAEAKVPMVVNAENPAKFIDPATGEPTDATELPAMKDGKQVGTYTIDPATGKVTFTPNKDFVGTPDAITVQAKDANGTPATATYTPTVTPVTPTGEDKTTTGKQGQVQKETVKFTEGDSEVPMKIDADQPAKFIDPATGEPTDATELPAMKDGKQVGTYKLDPLTGEVTFTPNKDFVGTPDGISVQAKDANGTPATAKYTPTVTAVTPTAEDVTSTGKQGQTQKETPKFTEGDSEVPMKIDADQPAKFIDPATGEPTDETTLPAMKDGKQVGTYTIDPTTGEVTFTPNKDFVGTPDGITVQAKDANGTPATAKYTPTVTAVTPTAEDVTSTGKQGQVQKETPKFTEGDSDVPMKIDADQPAKFIDPTTGEPTDETTLPAMKDGKQVGTYTINPTTGEVTFTPNKDFVGTPDAITVQAKDANGTAVTATYTPTVTPVTPTGEDVETTGKQGQEQKQTPKFTEGDEVAPITINADQPAKFIDPATGEPTDATTLPAMKDGKQVGTYTIDPLTGEVTFKPNKDFVGTPDGITVQAKDANGTPATAKYTPTVTPVTPTSEDVESTGKQGQKQKQTPKFTEGDPVAPITINADQPAKFIDPTTGEPTDATELPAMKDGKQVGTYTIDPTTGEVTFTPNKDFVGTPDGITVQAKDANGTPVTAKYTPTVTPVTPTAEDAETTDVQGKTQTAKPKFTEGDSDVPLDDTVPATFEDGSTTKVIPGVGTFTVAPDGTITFVPEPNFTGVAPAVTIQRVDVNGTVVKANYVATVTPAPAKPVEVEPTTTTPEPAKPQQELPNTGTSDEYGVFSAAALSILASVGLVATSRKKDEEQEA